MSPSSENVCPSSWLILDVTHERPDVYRSQSSQSTLSTASDASTALSRTDVSPFSLNGHGSSRETSPATSSCSNKTRRYSDAMDADEDELMSSNAPIPTTKRHKSSFLSYPASTSSSTLSIHFSETSVKRSSSAVHAHVMNSNDNATVQFSRTLFVESLVGTCIEDKQYFNILAEAAVATISSTWGRFSRESRVCEQDTMLQNNTSSNNPLPLVLFVREILRRSRTSCLTLQAALLYCARCKESMNEMIDKATNPISNTGGMCWLPHTDAFISSQLSLNPNSQPPMPPVSIRNNELCSDSRPSNKQQPTTPVRSTSPLLCGRRMFLAAIVVASKFLQDRTYSNRTWSKISGLRTIEIDQLERVFLRTIRYDLVVSDALWRKWTADLSSFCSQKSLHAASGQHSDKPFSTSSASRLHRVTSENVIGQAFQFDSSLNKSQPSAVHGKRIFTRHGSSF